MNGLCGRMCAGWPQTRKNFTYPASTRWQARVDLIAAAEVSSKPKISSVPGNDG